MVDSDLRSLRARLQATLSSRVEGLSEGATEEEYLTLLGALGALRRVASRIHELDSGARAPEDAGERSRLVKALHTLSDELAR